MYGSRSTSKISTLESHKFNCSSVGGLVCLLRRSISSENVIELPASGVVEMGVSVFISVDNGMAPNQIFICVYPVGSQEERRKIRRSRTFVPVCPTIRVGNDQGEHSRARRPSRRFADRNCVDGPRRSVEASFAYLNDWAIEFDRLLDRLARIY